MSDGVHDKQLLVSVAVVFAAVLFASFASDVESRSLYKDKPLKDEQTDKVQPPQNDVKTTRKNTLLHSTLVIIAIILFIVLGVMGIYYWVLFYPILCKKERKYDVMQMSAKP